MWKFFHHWRFGYFLTLNLNIATWGWAWNLNRLPQAHACLFWDIQYTQGPVLQFNIHRACVLKTHTSLLGFAIRFLRYYYWRKCLNFWKAVNQTADYRKTLYVFTCAHSKFTLQIKIYHDFIFVAINFAVIFFLSSSVTELLQIVESWVCATENLRGVNLKRAKHAVPGD